MHNAAVFEAALELFRCRSYAGTVAVCSSIIDQCPENVDLRLLYARSLLALRRDAEAQQQLSQCLEQEPRCAEAYFHLGELALRRDELKSAEIFLREARRIDPHDLDIAELLAITIALHQPTAVADKLPAAAAVVGCPSPPRRPARRGPEPRRQRRASTLPLPVATAPTMVAREARLAFGTCSEQKLFGEYLVEIGALSPIELKASLAYHHSAGVRLGGAAVALGFISAPKVEWAAMAFHGSYRH